jgi:hypothetical protein
MVSMAACRICGLRIWPSVGRGLTGNPLLQET